MSINNGSNGKVAVILGHPAHVLRIYRFIEIYKPIIYIITDGSGSKGESKLDHVTRIIEDCGASTSRLTCRFTDAEMYRVIRDAVTETLHGLVEELSEDLGKNDVAVVAGDAIEGFNPIHDLCRYLINAAVKIHSSRKNRTVGNFDLLLDGPPDQGSNGDGSIRIKLSAEDFARKMQAINAYPGIEPDIQKAMRLYGENAFQNESLRPVRTPDQLSGWDTDVPFYESYGAKMVESGVYSEVITFEKHLLPLAKYLSSLADTNAAHV